MKKFIVFLIFITFLGFIGWKIYQKINTSNSATAAQGPRGPVPVAVQVEPVIKTTVRDISLFTGTLHPRSQFRVAPKIGGRLKKLFVNIGDRVQNGQLIARLDNDEYIQQVDEARAELVVAKARIEESRSKMDVALRDLERVRELRQKNISSQSALDNAEAQYGAQSAAFKVAQAQFAQKQASLKAAEVRLGYTSIHASWENGKDYRIIGERFVDEGAMLAPQSPIVSIIEMNTLTAVIYVIERDYPKVANGQAAIINTDAYPGMTFSGKIIRVAPLLKETSRQARVEIELPNPDNILKPGMFIRIEIELERHDDATVVPLSALVKRDGHEGVFIADQKETRAVFIPVTPGISEGELVELLDPPLTGMVVTMGQHLLSDGSPIILPGLDSDNEGMKPVAPNREGSQSGGRP